MRWLTEFKTFWGTIPELPAVQPKEHKMASVRDTLQAEITKAEADLAALKAKLASYEAEFSDFLSADYDRLKTFFAKVEGKVESVV